MSFGDFAIAPSTTVTLCKGVPLSKGSEDTFLFSSASAQASKISSYGFATFSNLTYQRNTRNVVRVGMSMGTSGANSALRANYLIFNNTAFEGKNIYAFVDAIDYVNNNTIDITFTIDAMQTFMFDYELRQCYVEREHSATDNFGDNLVPEEFGSFENTIHHKDDYYRFTGPLNHKYDCVIYYIANKGVYKDTNPDHPHTWYDDPSEYSVAGRYANNVYIAATASIMPATTAANGIDVEIERIISLGGTIINIQMIPHEIIAATDGGTGIVKTGGQFLQNNSFVQNGETFYPRNKKLLSYPFCYLTVSNNSGEERQYRWEYFAGDGTHGNLRIAQFDMYGGYQPAPQCALVPLNYKGLAVNYGDAVQYNAFPSSAWSEDSFLNWQLRNGNSTDAATTANKVGTISSMVSSALAGAAVGSSAGPVGTIAGAGVGLMAPLITGGLNQQKIDAQLKDAQATPDKLGGTGSSAIVNEVIGNTGFTLYSMQLPNAIAKTIDDYFTMYGYATRRVKIPNISSRPRFNYVKTQGCTIYGDVPAEFEKEIQDKFNNGVRFWKPSATIGDYTSPNEP